MKSPRRQLGPGILLTESNDRTRSPRQYWVPIGSVTSTSHWPKPLQPSCIWLIQTVLPVRTESVLRLAACSPSLWVRVTQRWAGPAILPAISAIGALLAEGGGAVQPARAAARLTKAILMVSLF